MKLRVPRENKFIVLFSLVGMIFLMFYDVLSNTFSIISYIDEVFSVVIFAYYLIKSINKGISKEDLFLVLSVPAIFVIGLIGNYTSNAKMPYNAILIDFFCIIKVIIVFIAAKNIYSISAINYLTRVLSKVFQAYVWLAAICYFPAYYFFNWMFSQYRFGIGTYGFISGAGAMGYLLMAAYCIFEMRGQELKYAKLTKILCLILMILSLKGQALLFVAFLCFLQVIIKGKKLKLYHIILLVLTGVTVGFWQIKTYLLDPNEARAVMNVAAFKISRDCFPFGTGFATFGTDMSKKFVFSPIYERYGLTHIRGLNAIDSMYIQDNYWAMILGELGVIGLIVFAAIYFYIYKHTNYVMKSRGESFRGKNAFLSMFFAFMAASIGSPYLTAAQGVMCLFIMGIFLKKINCNMNKISEG